MTSEPSSGADTPLNGAQKRHGESIDTDRPRQIPRQSGPEPAPATPAKHEPTDEGVGEAGPGPQTARRRSLGPVPQPSPSVFHRIMEEQQRQQASTQSSDIGTFSSPPGSAPLPETKGVLTVVDGEEAYVAPDSDSDSTQFQSLGQSNSNSNAQSQSQSEPIACAFAGCGQTFGTPTDLAAHIRQHADAIAPPPTDRISELEGRIAEQETSLREKDVEVARLQARIEDLERDPPEFLEILSQSTPGTSPDAADEIASLKKKLKSTTLALKSAHSDLSFFRAQYDVASTSAVREVSRAERAELKVVRLKEQLSLGLKQRNLHFSATLEAHAKSEEKARYQLQLLLGQSRRTDDKIRHRAAQHERLLKENRTYETELHEARSRADVLQKRNNELLDQVATLRGRLMGAFDSVGSSATDSEAEDAEADTKRKRGVFTRESEFKQRLAMPALSVPTPEDRPLTPVVQDVMLAAPAGASAQPTTELMFKCKWESCAAIFVGRQELETHALGHVQAELDQ